MWHSHYISSVQVLKGTNASSIQHVLMANSKLKPKISSILQMKQYTHFWATCVNQNCSLPISECTIEMVHVAKAPFPHTQNVEIWERSWTSKINKQQQQQPYIANAKCLMWRAFPLPLQSLRVVCVGACKLIFGETLMGKRTKDPII